MEAKDSKGKSGGDDGIPIADRIRHPALLELYAYWLSKRHGSRLPSRRDLDPVEFWPYTPYVMLVDVLRDPLDFRFRLVGTRIVDANGYDVTGCLLAECGFKEREPEIRARYVHVVRTGEAEAYDSSLQWQGRGHVTYQVLLMPLAPPDGPIDMIFGAIVYDMPLAGWKHA